MKTMLGCAFLFSTVVAFAAVAQDADDSLAALGQQDAAASLKLVGPRDLPGDDVVVQLEPAFGSGGPRWSPKGATVRLDVSADGQSGAGRFDLGPEQLTFNRAIRVLLSRSSADAPTFDVLAIDMNRDGRFSDDERMHVKPNERRGKLWSSWSAAIDLRVDTPDGGSHTIAYPINLWYVFDPQEPDAPAELRWSRRGWMHGTAQVGDESFHVALAEMSMDGVYNNTDSWIIARQKSGIESVDYRACDGHVWLGDDAWRIVDMHPSGMKVTLRRFDPGHTRAEEQQLRDQFAADRTAPRAEQPLAFGHDFANAEAQSRQTGNALFIDFETTWCGPCKTMDAMVYTARDVVDAARASGIICVKVDGDEHRDIVKRFGVRAYPTMILLDSDGTELRRAVGYQSVAKMRTFLTLAGQQHVASDQHSRPMQEPQQTQQHDEHALWAAYLDAKRSNDAASAEAASAKLQSVLKARLAVNQRDGYALLRMGKLLHDAEQYDAAVEYYQRAGALGGDFEMHALVREGGIRAEQGRYEEASVLLRKALEIRNDEGVREFLKVIESRMGVGPAEEGGTIRGTVLDGDFDAPIPGCTVTIVETGAQTTTADDGTYTFDDVPAGKYTIAFEVDGYERGVRTNITVKDNQLVNVNRALTGVYVDMEDFVIDEDDDFDSPLVRKAQALVKEKRYADATELLRRALELEDNTNVREFLKAVERVADRQGDERALPDVQAIEARLNAAVRAGEIDERHAQVMLAALQRERLREQIEQTQAAIESGHLSQDVAEQRIADMRILLDEAQQLLDEAHDRAVSSEHPPVLEGNMPRAIIIAITADDQIIYAGRDIGINGVQPLVARMIRNEQAQVIIKADQDADSGVLVRVIDEAKRAGAKSVSIVKRDDSEHPPALEDELSPAIIIAITADGQISYAGRDIGINGVQPLVARMIRNEQAKVIIKADQDADSGVLVRVIGEAKRAGAKSVSIVKRDDSEHPPALEDELSPAIIIDITADGRIIYAGRDIGISGVHPVVARLLDEEPMPVIIAIARDADSGVLVRVIDEAKRAGADSISIVKSDSK